MRKGPNSGGDDLYVIKTFQGLEDVLAEEVQLLGGKNVRKGNRVVTCFGDQALGYRLNYELRTGLSVLTPLKSGRTPNEHAVYDLFRSIQWDRVFRINKTFLIDMVCYSDRFRNTHFLALKCKDAIVDQFREKYGRRPSISKCPDVKINVFIKDADCKISLDLSGASLFKRDYRYTRGIAPINEVLAAGLIKLAGWDEVSPFVDPMCGSGTFVMEAAMMARRQPAQFYRKNFSLMHLNNFSQNLWEKVVDEANSRIQDQHNSIIGRDRDPEVLKKAEMNAVRAMQKGIRFEQGDFFNWQPDDPPGVMIMNPPYDQRIDLEDAIAFYKDIGDHFKQHCKGWKAWIISSHLKALKRVGLKPIRRIPVHNGPLDCRLVGFDLY